MTLDPGRNKAEAAARTAIAPEPQPCRGSAAPSALARAERCCLGRGPPAPLPHAPLPHAPLPSTPLPPAPLPLAPLPLAPGPAPHMLGSLPTANAEMAAAGMTS
jgi:hypothetical protein